MNDADMMTEYSLRTCAGAPFIQSFMHDVIKANQRWAAGRPVLIFNDRVHLWRDVDRIVDGLRRGLASIGVTRGTRIAILDRNSDDYVFLHYALAGLGGVLVPINFWQRATEVAFVLDNATPEFVVIGEEFRALGAGTLSEAAHRPRVIARGAAMDGEIAFADLADGPEVELSAPHDWEDPHLILYTSGTTGRPKGVLVSHRRTVLDALMTGSAIHVQRAEIYYCYTPLFHAAGWDYIKIFFAAHGTVVLVDRHEPDTAVRLIEKYRCNTMFGVPLVLREMVECAAWKSADLSSLRMLYCPSFDTSNFLTDVLAAFRERGAREIGVVYPYGQTEAGPFISVTRFADTADHPGTVGMPMPGIDVAVLDDECVEVGYGEVGEICVRSPALMSGYLGNPEATAEAFKGGWLHTGDMGRIDEAGFLVIVDRKKDMVRTGAENVYAKEVEQVLSTHPAVADCAIVGLPDPDYGEKVVAGVIAAPGMGVNEAELVGFVRERIAGYKTPRHVVFVTEFPKTSLGKIQKNVLKQQLARLLGED